MGFAFMKNFTLEAVKYKHKSAEIKWDERD